MKKTYIEPSSEVVLVAVQQMLAASPDAAIDASKSVDAADIEGRSYDFDDED